jgi:hypothetical protein
MKTVISVASLLACAFSLDAQISATLIHASNGLDDVKIRNDSKISLVAYVVSVKLVPQRERPRHSFFRGTRRHRRGLRR